MADPEALEAELKKAVYHESKVKRMVVSWSLQAQPWLWAW